MTEDLHSFLWHEKPLNVKPYEKQENMLVFSWVLKILLNYKLSLVYLNGKYTIVESWMRIHAHVKNVVHILNTQGTHMHIPYSSSHCQSSSHYHPLILNCTRIFMCIPRCTSGIIKLFQSAFGKKRIENASTSWSFFACNLICNKLQCVWCPPPACSVECVGKKCIKCEWTDMGIVWAIFFLTQYL